MLIKALGLIQLNIGGKNNEHHECRHVHYIESLACIYILSGIHFTDTNVNYYMFAGLTVLAIAGVLTFILIVPVKRLVCVYF